MYMLYLYSDLDLLSIIEVHCSDDETAVLEGFQHFVSLNVRSYPRPVVDVCCGQRPVCSIVEVF